MLQKNESPVFSEDPPTGPPEVLAAPTPPKPAKRWPWIVAGVVVILVAAGAALWWLLDSTVPAEDYDNVVAELAASDEALTGARAESAKLQADVDALNAESEELAAELAIQTEQADELSAYVESLQGQSDAAMAAAKLYGYLSLDWLPEDVEAMQQVGVDTASADALLEELGRTEAWVDWVETADVWLMRDTAVTSIGDDALTDAWVRWLEAEIGSVEEMAAWAEFHSRLAFLILDPLTAEQLS